MEVIQDALVYLMPIVIVPMATGLAKKWFNVESPITKFIIAAVISTGIAAGLTWIYMPTFDIRAVLQLAVQVTLQGIFGKVVWKAYQNSKTPPQPTQ